MAAKGEESTPEIHLKIDQTPLITQPTIKIRVGITETVNVNDEGGKYESVKADLSVVLEIPLESEANQAIESITKKLTNKLIPEKNKLLTALIGNVKARREAGGNLKQFHQLDAAGLIDKDGKLITG
jgi:hypothetical protein